MNNRLTPKQCVALCKWVGLGLLFAVWVRSGETAAFFLFLFLVVMSLLRWRFPRWNATVIADIAVVALLSLGGYVPVGLLALPLFEAMYGGLYGAAFGIAYALYRYTPSMTAILALAALCGYFVRSWERERRQKQHLRDTEAGRYYELESLQNDMVAAMAQIEQMTAVAERTRIARDIHDNAGHEIVAASMTFQTIRTMIPPDHTEMNQLYDAALARLANGTEKIREAVHNLSSVHSLGVERLREKCLHFSICSVDFKAYGDTSHVPIYVWNMLESCLNEALTNIARHSRAAWVTVTMDATPHIVRLCVANDGVIKNNQPPGHGLRNLRQRAAAIGGSLSTDIGETFNMICVIPVRPTGMNFVSGTHV